MGDAGFTTKDPATAQGITDTFTGAEWCAQALDEIPASRRGYEEAKADYLHRRDTATAAIYELTTQFAILEPPPPQMQRLMAATAGSQAAMDSFVSSFAGTPSHPPSSSARTNLASPPRQPGSE